MCHIEFPDLLAGLKARHSVRAYLAEPLSAELLKSVMEGAVCAPSAKNVQPWEAYVVSGDAMTRMRQALDRAFTAGERVPLGVEGEAKIYNARSHELFREMAPYIEKTGWDMHASVRNSIRMFEAPTAVFLCMDKNAAPGHLLDLGIFVENLCLSALAHGLGSCIIGYVRMVEPAVREFLKLSEDQRFLLAVALGYPDAASPMNQFHSSRVSMEESVHFLS